MALCGFAMQQRLTALRVLAYSLATLFIIVMVVRGVSLTIDEMEAEAKRSVEGAAATMTAVSKAGPIDPNAARIVLDALEPTGVDLRLVKSDEQPARRMEPNSEIETIKLGGGIWSLIATTDHAAIQQAAIRANLPFIAFVTALGLSVIIIFLYIGWAVNRPALQLLAFAQGGPDAARQPPKLPQTWNSVLARLNQLRESQAQMQAFLDHADEALDTLQTMGLRTAICTNKPERRALALFDALGWTDKFNAIIGGDTLPVTKPDAAPLREAIARCGGGRAVMSATR